MKNKEVKYLIRKAVIEDYLSMHRVYFETWLDTYPNKKFNIKAEDIVYKFNKKLDKKQVLVGKERISKIGKKELLLVLEYQGEIIALCNALEKDSYNQLQAIYVLPKYHGLGFGYALWQEAKNIFNPHKDIIVNVASYNNKAINFYKRLGFKRTGKMFFDERFRMRNGAMIPEIEMIIKNKY